MATGGRDNIFTSCRKGDLQRVMYLVEKKEVNVNVRDCWDSTPLYYACHCGHIAVVEYLLAHGARCEENTFDGERCIYGALTSEIKCLLYKSKIASMNTWKRDDFDEFCEKLLTAEEFSDFTLRLGGGKIFKLHRCILSARSPGLNSLLATKWRDLNDVTNNIIDPKVFEEFVKFLYTGKLKCTKDQCDEMIRLANRCRVQGMVPLLEGVRVQSMSFERSKRNIKVTTLVLDTPRTKQTLQEDFCAILDPGVEEDLSREPFLQFCHTRLGEEEDFLADEDEGLQTYYDVCLKVGDARFYCNKVFLCVRCPYFQALFHDYFGEYHETCNKVPVYTLRDVSPPVLALVLYFIYTNSAFNLNLEIVFDVLEAADIYILPGLKKLCGEFLCKTIDLSNVVDLLETARLRELPRLETRCTEFLAENFCSVMDDENFRALVIRDANEVECRQETDSIPIIDDIRYHIATHVDSFGYLDESQHILRIVDDFLVELGLEA